MSHQAGGRCHECGTAAPTGANFCRSCGAALRIGEPPPHSSMERNAGWRLLLRIVASVVGVASISALAYVLVRPDDSGSAAADVATVPPPRASAGTASPATTTTIAVTEHPRFVSAATAAARSRAPASPGVIELPMVDADEAADVAKLLADEGAALVQFFAVVESIWDQAPLEDDDCAAFRQQLEDIAPPDELGAMAWRLEDEPGRDVLGALIAFTVEFAAGCGADDDISAEVAWNWATGYRRLAELGVSVP